jgi:hypothetical protein
LREDVQRLREERTTLEGMILSRDELILEMAEEYGLNRMGENNDDEDEDSTSLNSFVILGAWTLWKHSNQCVFDDASPNLVAALSQAEEERAVWELAGAKEITFLMAQLKGE